LRLHTREGLLAGGESGAALVAGDAAASELLRRLRLPIDDPDHMPPDDKPQPREAEIVALERWIAAGAPFEGAVAGLEPVASDAELVEAIAPASEASLAALRAELVHVQPIAGGSNGLWIDFAAIASRTDDALARRLLQPLAQQTLELSLARCRIGASTLELCATMPNLRRLDLRGTAVGDAELARLAGHARLEELVVVRTRITDASLASLQSLPALRRVFAWGCGMSVEGLAQLRSRSSLLVDAGDAAASAVAETEPPPKFTCDAPIPGAPPPGDPSAPINATCPVTGSPVNPKYTLTHDGRVVGFCCPNCPKEFERDPAKYASKLP
jgi:YHS domain-containing protein